MKRSVIIDTPIPTLEEFRKSLGLSKARQKSLERIVLGEKALSAKPQRARARRKPVAGAKPRFQKTAK
jgi:hypothetical protein